MHFDSAAQSPAQGRIRQSGKIKNKKFYPGLGKFSFSFKQMTDHNLEP